MNDIEFLERHLPEADLLEGAFIARALATCGHWEPVSAFHTRTAEYLLRSEGPLTWQIAAWLWSAGEDLGRMDEPLQQTVLTAAKRLLPQMVSRSWPETVAYGAIYSALRVLEPYLPGLEPGRHLRAIREFVINRATCGGRLAAVPGGEGLDASLLLLVPFGLFDPGELLMVATVQALEAQGVTTDSAIAWLIWYYQVKGTNPRRLAQLQAQLPADSLWAHITRVLYGKAGIHAPRIRHLPTGHDHPYHRYTPERIPRDPVEGRPVELRATVTDDIGPLQVEWTENGEPRPTLPARFSPPHWQEEGYWFATIGPFPAGTRVRYRWVGKETATDWYEFGVLAENGISRALGLELCEDGQVEITCADLRGTRTVRVILAMGPKGTLQVQFRPAEGGTCTPPRWEGKERLQLGDWTVEIQAVPFRLRVLDQTEQVLLVDHPDSGWRWWEDPDGRAVRVQHCLTLAAGERLYGTGERFDRLDRRGTVVLNTVYNEYKQQGDRTYLPVPFLLSSRGYGLWVKTNYVGEIDAGATVTDRLRLTFSGPGMDLVLIPGPRPLQVLERFTALTGHPALPPRWAFGPWMSSHNWDNQAEVMRQVAVSEQYDIPASVLVIEAWSDESTFYLFNDAQYQPRRGSEVFKYSDFTFPSWGRWPDPRGMVEDLHARGMRVLLWQIPVWKNMGGIRHRQHDLDETFLIEQGYVVKRADGSPYRIPEGWFAGSLLIDFTNPKAVEWWLAKRRYLLEEIGIDGFKTDGGEFVWDRDVRLANGLSGEEARNLYVNLYIGTVHRFVQKCTGGDGVTFSRAGYTGAQQFPLHWAGDEASTWSALRASIIAGLNAGIAGIPFWGWDLGGFSGDIPTAELFCRSAAMACFCPVMQYHAESQAQQNQDRTPWNIAERTGRPEVLSVYRFFAQLRMNLVPYLYHCAIESVRTGVPVMRALFLMHPEDPACGLLADQYYLGSDLLVAPVVEPGALGREVYLPEGIWYDFWTGRQIRGPSRIWCTVPWDRIPVFVRAGAVIPLSLSDSGKIAEGMRHGDAANLRNLHLYIYPATENFSASIMLTPEKALTIEGQYQGHALTLHLPGQDQDLWLHAVLPDLDGNAVTRTLFCPAGAATALRFDLHPGSRA